MKSFYKIILSLGLVAVLIYLYVTYLKDVTPTELANYLKTYGHFAPFVYIVLFTFVPLTLFPDAILAIAAGLIFGPLLGGLYTMIGALCGGSLAYFIACYMGDKLAHHTKALSTKTFEKLRTQGFSIVLILRLIPLVPFDVISYACGISKVSYKSFISATLLGIIPGVTLLVNIGAGMNELGSPRLYIATAFFVLLLAYSPTIKNKLLAD